MPFTFAETTQQELTFFLLPQSLALCDPGSLAVARALFDEASHQSESGSACTIRPFVRELIAQIPTQWSWLLALAAADADGEQLTTWSALLALVSADCSGERKLENQVEDSSPPSTRDNVPSFEHLTLHKGSDLRVVTRELDAAIDKLWTFVAAEDEEELERYGRVLTDISGAGKEASAQNHIQMKPHRWKCSFDHEERDWSDQEDRRHQVYSSTGKFDRWQLVRAIMKRVNSAIADFSPKQLEILNREGRREKVLRLSVVEAAFSNAEEGGGHFDGLALHFAANSNLWMDWISALERATDGGVVEPEFLEVMNNPPPCAAYLETNEKSALVESGNPEGPVSGTGIRLLEDAHHSDITTTPPPNTALIGPPRISGRRGSFTAMRENSVKNVDSQSDSTNLTATLHREKRKESLPRGSLTKMRLSVITKLPQAGEMPSPDAEMEDSEDDDIEEISSSPSISLVSARKGSPRGKVRRNSYARDEPRFPVDESGGGAFGAHGAGHPSKRRGSPRGSGLKSHLRIAATNASSSGVDADNFSAASPPRSSRRGSPAGIRMEADPSRISDKPLRRRSPRVYSTAAIESSHENSPSSLDEQVLVPTPAATTSPTGSGGASPSSHRSPKKGSPRGKVVRFADIDDESGGADTEKVKSVAKSRFQLSTAAKDSDQSIAPGSTRLEAGDSEDKPIGGPSLVQQEEPAKIIPDFKLDQSSLGAWSTAGLKDYDHMATLLLILALIPIDRENMKKTAGVLALAVEQHAATSGTLLESQKQLLAPDIVKRLQRVDSSRVAAIAVPHDLNHSAPSWEYFSPLGEMEARAADEGVPLIFIDGTKPQAQRVPRGITIQHATNAPVEVGATINMAKSPWDTLMHAWSEGGWVVILEPGALTDHLAAFSHALDKWKSRNGAFLESSTLLTADRTEKMRDSSESAVTDTCRDEVDKAETRPSKHGMVDRPRALSGAAFLGGRSIMRTTKVCKDLSGQGGSLPNRVQDAAQNADRLGLRPPHPGFRIIVMSSQRPKFSPVGGGDLIWWQRDGCNPRQLAAADCESAVASATRESLLCAQGGGNPWDPQAKEMLSRFLREMYTMSSCGSLPSSLGAIATIVLRDARPAKPEVSENEEGPARAKGDRSRGSSRRNQSESGGSTAQDSMSRQGSPGMLSTFLQERFRVAVAAAGTEDEADADSSSCSPLCLPLIRSSKI
jgi:hypothetical protein